MTDPKPAEQSEQVSLESEPKIQDPLVELKSEFSSFKQSFLDDFKRYAESQDKKDRNTRNRLKKVLGHLDPDFEEAKSDPDQGNQRQDRDTVNPRDVASLVLKQLELANLKATLSDEQKRIVDSLDPEIASAVIAAFNGQASKQAEPERPRVSVQDAPSMAGPIAGGGPIIKTRSDLNRLSASPQGREQISKWRKAGGSVADLKD